MIKWKVLQRMAELGIRFNSDLSKRSGVSENSLGPIVKGEAERIDRKTLDRLCEALDCQPGDLLEHTPLVEKVQSIQVALSHALGDKPVSAGRATTIDTPRVDVRTFLAGGFLQVDEAWMAGTPIEEIDAAIKEQGVASALKTSDPEKERLYLDGEGLRRVRHGGPP